MPQGDSAETLVVPALRARTGDWVYYIGYMKMRDVAQRISIAKELHSSESLRDLLQRELTKRRTEIATYLLTQKQRFFNAIVVGSFGGNPQWNELTIKQPEFASSELPDNLEGVMGILMLDGTEKLFAIDGQHRIAGIRLAIKESTALEDEEICVIFVAGITQEYRDKDPVGFERTRRLFTTLNRYAKPVSKRDIIALDEDDIVAIVTRLLVEEYALLQNKISVRQTKSIQITDRRSITTIVTLYDALDIYLQADSTSREWKRFKRSRPSDEQVEMFLNKSRLLWDLLAQNFPPIDEVLNHSVEDEVASNYRHEYGGHLLFRPIGFLLVVRVIQFFVTVKLEIQDAVQLVARAPMELSNTPWSGILWDAVNKRMLTTPENQKAAFKLLVYSLGGDLSVFRINDMDLRQEIAGILKKDISDVVLPKYV